MYCHICSEKISSGRDHNMHYASCKPKSQSKDEFRVALIQHSNTNIYFCPGLFKSLYTKKGYSTLELSKILNLPYSSIQFFIKFYKIEKRSLNKSTTNRVKDKRAKTNLQLYGHENCLGKNTPAYHKRNNTIKERYGVDNVFQIKEIIDHINGYMLETYGRLRISNPEKQKETKQNWSEEFKIEYGDKISKIKRKNNNPNLTDEQLNELVKNRNNILLPMDRMNLFESKISSVLTKMNLSHSFAKKIDKYYPDFVLENSNILIECQGDFWHANPKFYRPGEILSFPKEKIKTDKIWANDYKKLKNYTSLGYRVIYIWENDIHHQSDDEICEFICNLLQRELHHFHLNLQP
jgi:G:T-mismatch repair DNA endonuclease (very short patch repair protein)